ncbi:MAG: hypothetical protein Q8R34_02200 [bacterium]|nr:hypothetical protein [bacterium]
MTKNAGSWIVFSAIIANFILGFGFNYYRFSWFDTSLHFFGGLGVYLILSSYFRSDLAGLLWLRRTILLVGATVLVGVIWEFAEYSFTTIPAILSLPWDGLSFIGDLPDTLTDLSLDLLGALFGSILHFFRKS